MGTQLLHTTVYCENSQQNITLHRMSCSIYICVHSMQCLVRLHVKVGLDTGQTLLPYTLYWEYHCTQDKLSFHRV